MQRNIASPICTSLKIKTESFICRRKVFKLLYYVEENIISLQSYIIHRKIFYQWYLTSNYSLASKVQLIRRNNCFCFTKVFKCNNVHYFITTQRMQLSKSIFYIRLGNLNITRCDVATLYIPLFDLHICF